MNAETVAFYQAIKGSISKAGVETLSPAEEAIVGVFAVFMRQHVELARKVAELEKRPTRR